MAVPLGAAGVAHRVGDRIRPVLASTVLAMVDGPLLHRPGALHPEEWGILAVHVLAVSSFLSLMTVLVRAWAIVPTWLFFVILGDASSGGAVAPPLLPQPFAFLSQWLPSGATVSALRNGIYFRDANEPNPQNSLLPAPSPPKPA